MPKLLVMTDVHVTEPPETIIGLNPEARLRQGLAHAAARHPDAECLIITGDLAHHGRAGEYARLKGCLVGLPWPVHLMIGNHDDRATFRAAFPDTPVDGAGYVQDIIDLEATRLILLDSVDHKNPVEHRGRICTKRMAWLTEALDSAGNRPCVVFLHHPPFDTGFTGMDGIGLENAAELRDLLKRSNVAHIIAGHVHRNIHATIDGLPMSVLKSTCDQMPLALGEIGHDQSLAEPGAYGVVIVDGADVTVFPEDFTLEGIEVVARGFE